MADTMTFDAERVIRLAKDTLRIEADALLAMIDRQDSTFAGAVRALLECRGRVVVMGIGKSGLVGRKIAATLASTGTPAFFVHVAEASHGDLGMVTEDDVIVMASNSGGGDELGALLPTLKRLGVPMIAITGNASSPLGECADYVLNSAVDKEACPLNLAPTASTTAQMALGDALAVALLDARGFRAEDFAKSHPGGSLGRKLLTHVRDVMRSGAAVPHVGPCASVTDMMQEMTTKGLGATAIVDDAMKVLGIFTDGDLRRLVEKGIDLRALKAEEVMTPKPRVVSGDALAVEAADLMERFRVTSILVADPQGTLVGALNSNDLMRAKVI